MRIRPRPTRTLTALLAAVALIRLGGTGSIPVTGDWDGNGTTTIGVAFPIVTGDWNGDRTWTHGVA